MRLRGIKESGEWLQLTFLSFRQFVSYGAILPVMEDERKKIAKEKLKVKYLMNNLTREGW